MPRARAPGRWLAARWWVNGPLCNHELYSGPSTKRDKGKESRKWDALSPEAC